MKNLELEYKRNISFEDMVSFVDYVVNAVFSVNEETGEMIYYPELYDYTYRLMIAKYYGGYEVVGDLEKDYEVAMQVDVYNLTTEKMEIDRLQLFAIEDAILNKIDYMKEKSLNKDIRISSQLDFIVPKITELLDTVTEKVNSVNSEELQKAVSQLNKFGNVNDFVKAYTNTEFATQNREQRRKNYKNNKKNTSNTNKQN